MSALRTAARRSRGERRQRFHLRLAVEAPAREEDGEDDHGEADHHGGEEEEQRGEGAPPEVVQLVGGDDHEVAEGGLVEGAEGDAEPALSTPVH